jgi:hypothetical protein
MKCQPGPVEDREHGIQTLLLHHSAKLCPRRALLLAIFRSIKGLQIFRRAKMSRPVAAVIGIALGLPVLAMIALASIGAFHPGLLMTFLVGGAVMTFVVGAIFEIKRIADLDGRDHSHQAEILLAEALSEPKVYEAAAPVAVREEANPSPPQSAGLQTLQQAASAPDAIVVEAQTEEAAAETVTSKAGPKKRSSKVSSQPAVPLRPEEVAPLATKNRRKSAQRKPARTA